MPDQMVDCDTCGEPVSAEHRDCPGCGAPIGTRLCVNGHVMDPGWLECAYCREPAAVREPRSTPGSGDTGAGDGGHEDSAWSPSGRSRGFDQGATILDDRSPTGSGVGEPVHGSTGDDAPGASWKAKTVFDSGVAPGQGTDRLEHPKARQNAPARAARLVGWLVTFDLDPAGKDFRLREGRNVVGADADCDVRLESVSEISGHHAVVMFRGEELRIRDSDSTNGTYVNGQDIFGRGAVGLCHKDRIRLGNLELELHVL